MALGIGKVEKARRVKLGLLEKRGAGTQSCKILALLNNEILNRNTFNLNIKYI